MPDLNYLASARLWLYGLLSSVISGASGATAVVVIDPAHFNIHEGLTNLFEVAIVMGVIALFNYLQKQPLPTWDGYDRRDVGADVVSASTLNTLNKQP